MRVALNKMRVSTVMNSEHQNKAPYAQQPLAASRRILLRKHHKCSPEHPSPGRLIQPPPRLITCTATRSSNTSLAPADPLDLPREGQSQNAIAVWRPKAPSRQKGQLQKALEAPAEAAVEVSSAQVVVEVLPSEAEIALEAKTEEGLFWARMWYFTHSAALVFIMPYLGVYYKSMGFTEADIGILFALRPWINAPCASMWASVADKSRTHRPILLLAFIISTLTRSSMALSGMFAIQLLLTVLTEVFSAPISVIADSAVMASVKHEGDYGQQRMWGAIGWGLFSAVAGIVIANFGLPVAFVCYLAISAVAIYPTIRLPVEALHRKMDAMIAAGQPAGQLPEASTSQATALANNIVPAGRITATGTAPCSSSGSLSGLPNNQLASRVFVWGLGPRVVRDSVVRSFARIGRRTYPGDMMVLGGFQGKSQSGLELEKKEKEAKKKAVASGAPVKEVSFWEGLQTLIADPEVALFFAMVTTMGFASGIINGYLFLYLQELGGNEAVMGLSLTAACASEVPIFFFAKSILSRFGVKNVLTMAMAGYVLRLGAYSCLASWELGPWAVLPIELLHGVSFGCSWAAGTVNVSRISPPHLRSTTQAIFSGLYCGVGNGIGGLLGGYVYQNFGGQSVFSVSSGVVLAGLVACTSAQIIIDQNKAKALEQGRS